MTRRPNRGRRDRAEPLANPTRTETSAVAPKVVEMRQAIVTHCSVVLLLTALAPAAAARPSAASPIHGVIDMVTVWVEGDDAACPMKPAIPISAAGDPTSCWYGEVTGDIAGEIAFFEDPNGRASAHASSWHFFEKFTVRSGDEWISGSITGLWSHTSAFRASGPVTDASAGWSSLIGYSYHERGTMVCGDDGACTANGVEFFLAKAGGDRWP